MNCHSFSHLFNLAKSQASAFRQPPCRYKETGVRSSQSQFFSRLKKSCFPSLSSQKCSTSAVSAEHTTADRHISSSSAVQETLYKAGHCIPDAVCWVPCKGERSLPLTPWFMLLLVPPGCCQPSLQAGCFGSSRLAPRQSVPNMRHFWRSVHPKCKTSAPAEFS